mgnify:CR=1 FL=1
MLLTPLTKRSHDTTKNGAFEQSKEHPRVALKYIPIYPSRGPPLPKENSVCPVGHKQTLQNGVADASTKDLFLSRKLTLSDWRENNSG